MQIVLNELSISSEPSNQAYINQVMDTFIVVYTRLRKEYTQLNFEYIAAQDILHRELAPGFPIVKWLNSKIDKDTKRILFSFFEKLKIFQPEEDTINCFTGNGEYGEGLQLAAENSAPVISFTFQESWKQNYIPCTIFISDDNSYNENLVNFSTEESIEFHQHWLGNRISDLILSIKTPQQLINAIDDKFSSLVFLDEAISDVNEISSAVIPIIIERLSQLESYFSTWDGKAFQRENFPNRTVSPESEETLKKFAKDHTYLYQGREILVSYHMRYTGAGEPGRIYFYPDHESKKCVICRLSTKLPTVKYPKFKDDSF